MRRSDWRALGGAGLGLLVLLGATWPTPAPRATAWRMIVFADVGRALSLAAPALAASPTPARTRPAVAPPSADHRLDRPPSISAARIDAVLAEYGSPAAGLGDTFYDLGVQYGIDPAYPLAFFIVESQAGTRGVARTTHSIGNIRCTPEYRCVEGYRAYDSWKAGLEDWYKLIRELYMDTWGLRTLSAILPRYAPIGDHNDPAAYALAVARLTDGWQL